MRPLECLQDFTKIWPSDLLFDPIPTMFEHDPDIIMTNILSKIEKDKVKSVAARVLSRFTKIWPSDLHFDQISPMLELDPDITKTIILSKFKKY